MSTASSAADYAVLIDLDDDGTPETDIVSWATKVTTQRGRSKELSSVEVGRCTIVLNNADGRFNPVYPSGAYYGNLNLYNKIQVKATLSATPYPMFTGYIVSFTPDGIGRTVTVQCVDEFYFLRNFHLNLAVASDKLTGDRMDAILDLFDATVSAAADLDTGQTTLPRPYWRNTDALTGLQECADHDLGGIIFMSAGGVFTFRDRNARALADSDGTITRMQGIEYMYSEDQLYTDVILQVGGYEEGAADSMIWTYQPLPVFLAKDATLKIDPNYVSPATSVTTPVEGTDYVANVQQDGSGTDLSSDMSSTFTDYGHGALWSITNNSPNGVWFQALKVRGTPLQLPTSLRTVSAQATSSIAPFDKTYEQTYRLLGLDNLTELQGWADYIASHYSEPHPRLSLTLFPHSDDSNAQLTQMLARELNDRVTITDDSFAYSAQVDEDFFIEGISHTLDPVSHAHETRWLLSTFTADSFFILDESVLDGEDVLAFVA
ncbi:MAG TPA: hypothetical protein VFS30_00565 [Dehalococcoidia bacterium]|nr:hypothetical protein [Dehalococcoidia bacterium]